VTSQTEFLFFVFLASFSGHDIAWFVTDVTTPVRMWASLQGYGIGPVQRENVGVMKGVEQRVYIVLPPS
jgi:hypothetical protein